MASATTTSKEDPTVQLWDFVQENLLQFHCENVSWKQASDKIPIKVVVELLGDLITHVNTCLLLRNNRLLFTLNWDTFENGPVVWEHLHSFHLNQKRRLETPQYQCDFMLTSVSSYPDLVDIYCYAFDKQSHPSFVREDIFEPGQLPVSESIEVWYLPPQFGSTPKKAIPQPVSTVRQPKSIQDMGHGELLELVQKLLKEKEEKPKPQTHLHPNPPPPLDFTESGNIPNPGMNQESFLQCSQIMLQGLADKGFIHAKSPKFDLFFGMKDKNKIEFDMWERQVLSAATDHSDTAIRQAMLQSLKGQALMVTTTLPPNTHWKELLQALRIKYQSKAPYDVLMSQFYRTKMDPSEDCTSFGIRLEQKLNQVTLQYPDKISTDGTDTVDIENMDTHIVNAIITGARSKSSLIESISSSPEIVPKELIADSNEPSLDWFKLQRADPSLAIIIHLMESDQLYKRKPYKKDSADIKSLLRIKKSLVLTKGILFRKSFTDNTSSKKIIWQLVIPKSHRHQAILGCHDEVGHQGRVRTLSLLRERFFWPNMQVEATQHIAKCSRCLKRKSTPHVAPLQPILVSQPLELVHLDYLSLEPSKGNIENVLVITDHFTRYALAYASKTQTAQATARILWDNFICHYGFPEQFISDQGRNFESDLIQELCKIAGVKKLHTTPYFM